LGESLGLYAQKKLEKRGVELRLKTKVIGYDGKEVALDDGTKIATRTLIWTAGITPPPLLSSLPFAKQRGRILANDLSRHSGQGRRPRPGIQYSTPGFRLPSE